MANEFGNVGAVSESQTRITSKQLETSTSTGGAEYEAFYGGYWRDISSDFSYDVSKAGNSFARCIRWDDGFRSYREDRGLIIRKKEKPSEDQTQEVDEDRGPVETFGRAFGVALGVNVLNASYNSFLKPKLAQTALAKLFTGRPGTQIGKFLGENKIALAFTGLNLLQNTGQSTSEKLGQAALSLGVGIALRKVGPAGAFIGAGIGIVEGLMTGTPIANILAGTAGNLAGRQVGRKISGSIFGTTTPAPTTQGQKTVNQGLLGNVTKQNIKSRVPDTLLQNRRLGTLTDALRGQLGEKVEVNIQKVPQQFKNMSNSYKENQKARIRNSDLGTNKAESLKLLADKLRNGRVF